MKTLLEPTDINTDDSVTRLVVIHVDSRARKDSQYIFLFSTIKSSLQVLQHILLVVTKGRA